MNGKILDFRSDTVTQPTEAMRAAMAAADVGDDTMGEDPTVRRIETLGAACFGKEAALFLLSGTMANQVAIMSLTQLGDEIIVGEDAHLFNQELAGVAGLSGVQARPVRAEAGRFDERAVRKAIRPVGGHAAVSRVLCLENTYDLSRGIPLDRAYLETMATLAHAHSMTVYLDGARIFNAAVSAQTTVAELCAPIDALQCCLSKGLAAPMGALLVGSRAFIDRARRSRQRLGGGMRQAGHMAAAGIVALEQMSARLIEDHRHARRLAEGLAEIDARLVDLATPMSNIVSIDFAAAGCEAATVVAGLADAGIKIRLIEPGRCRMATHWGIEGDDIDDALRVLKRVLRPN